MAKKETDKVPSANIPNVSANDPSNVSLNEYSKLKVKSDIKKKQKQVCRLEDLVTNHETRLEQNRKDLAELKLDIEKLNVLEKLLF
jgi:DNA polymerase II small subunit/DNA polymerase delta subunit B